MAAYVGMKRDELVDLCLERGLSTDGVKADLIARLDAWDAGQADPAEMPDSPMPVSEGVSTGSAVVTVDADSGAGDEEVDDEAEAEDEDEDEDEDEEPAPEPEPAVAEPEPAVAEPAVAAAESVASFTPAPHAEVPESDLANQGRPPNKRVAQPWDTLKVGLMTQLRAGAKDVWKDGEDLNWLGGIAESYAKQQWRAQTGNTADKRNALANLRHLEAQVQGRVAQIKMRLVAGGDDLLVAILKMAAKVIMAAFSL